MPMRQHLIVDNGFCVSKIDSSKPVSDLMKEIQADDEFPRTPLSMGRSGAPHHARHPAEPATRSLPDNWRGSELRDAVGGKRLRKLDDVYTPRHLRMKSTQRIDFYFPDAGERMSDGDLRLLVVFSYYSAFHGCDRELSHASHGREMHKWLREYTKRGERKKLARRQQPSCR